LLQWGRAFSSAEIRFFPIQNLHPSILLQWGRAFSSAEINIGGWCDKIHHGASMGPRFFKRGNWVMDFISQFGLKASMGPRFFKRGNRSNCCSCNYRIHCFNGAALFQARKLSWGAGVAWWRDASMGPRFFKRGNFQYSASPMSLSKLQWGRAFSSAEISSLPE